MDDIKRRRLQKLADLADNGNVAIIKYLFELEEKIDEGIPSTKELLQKVKGEKGDTYKLTKRDKLQIAETAKNLIDKIEISDDIYNSIDFKEIAEMASKYITVPQPREVDVEKIKSDVTKEVVKKLPKPKDGKDADENKIAERVEKNITLGLPKFGDAIRNSLELLKDDDRLDITAIRGLDNIVKPFDEKLFALENKIKPNLGGGSTARNLYQLMDVEITGLTDTQLLKYSSTSGTWVNSSDISYDTAVSDPSALGNLGATEVIDWSSSTHFTGTLDSDVTITHANEVSGQKITLVLAYDGVAQRTITWSDIDKWDGGTPPTTPSVAGEELVVSIIKLGATVYASANIFS